MTAVPVAPAILDHALDWHRHGYTPVPTRVDGSKAPAVTWQRWTHTQPERADVVAMFTSHDTDGLGLICGATSGGLEMFEAEGRAIDDGYADRLAENMGDHGLGDLWHLIDTGYKVATPSGGIHWHYRVDGDARPNTKLVRRPSTPAELMAWKEAEAAKAFATMTADKATARLAAIGNTTAEQVPQVLVETRGEGGFTVTAPSAGRTHPTGKAWTVLAGGPDAVPTITSGQRDALYAVAAMLDQMPAPEHPAPHHTPAGPYDGADGVRPGDDYANRTDWADILEPAGWTLKSRTRNGGRLWTRPGKETKEGPSGSTGINDGDNLYVFTTSTEFDPHVPYTKFGAYALLEHGGDHAAAAAQLRRDGYGGDRPRLSVVPNPADPFDTGLPPPGQPAPAPAAERDPAAEAQFWAARPLLAHVHAYARARMVSPWAVLGVTLARVAAATPYQMHLPPIIGGKASLNMFVGLVGPSGSGKSAAADVSVDAVRVADEPRTVRIASGEAITHVYKRREPGNPTPVWTDDDHAAIISVDEIDRLAGQAGRQGSTIMADLRSAWSGGTLGQVAADRTRSMMLEARQYRLCLIAGIQPHRADCLLGDADGGTPQRFLWLPALDPDGADQPDDPPEQVTVDTTWGPFTGAAFDVCRDARDEVVAQRARANRGDDDILNGHLLQVRLKVAAVLAVADRRHNVTVDDWALAGTVLDVSTATRDGVVEAQRAKASQANAAKAYAEAERQMIVSEQTERAAVGRVRGVLRRRLKRADDDGWVVRKVLRGTLASRDRGLFDEAIDPLIETGEVQYGKTAHGERYRLTP